MTYSVADLPAELAAQIRINPFTGCWEWTPRKRKGGEGTPDRFRHFGVKWDDHTGPVHRLVYKLLEGPIPPGHSLDHVYARGCRSNACCWPAHLEPVTPGENTSRGSRANIHHGVTLAVQRRIIFGRATAADMTLAQAIWMLPDPDVAAESAAAETPGRDPLQLYDIPAASQILGLPPERLRELREQKAGPFTFKISTRTWVYQWDDLMAWLAEHPRDEQAA